MKSWVISGALLLATAVAQAAPPAVPPLQAVAAVDLNRYQGRWYQIAHYPNAFQKRCASHTMADYQLLGNGQVQVLNSCKGAEGQAISAVGLARLKQTRFLGVALAAADSTAKLEVRFAPGWLSWVPGVWAPYWVIQLADDYRYAVVGEPSREYLWILSRTPELAPQDRATINSMLAQQGYDPAALKEEPRP